MSDDLISRKEAIRACYGMRRDTGIDEYPYEYAESELSSLPTVKLEQKTDRWIPIKEGPPKKNGDYFCTIRVVTYYTQVSPDSDEYEEHGVYKYVKVLNYQDGFPYGYNVIAWMPLPEVYKEDE